MKFKVGDRVRVSWVDDKVYMATVVTIPPPVYSSYGVIFDHARDAKEHSWAQESWMEPLSVVDEIARL